MTIFDIISDILFTKQKKSLLNIDNEHMFSPFMLNRWISMYSNLAAIKCNLLNKFLFLQKQEIYKLFFNLFNKVPTKKINYFKKLKDNSEPDTKLPLYANSLEISQREVKNYNEVLNFLKTSIN